MIAMPLLSFASFDVDKKMNEHEGQGIGKLQNYNEDMEVASPDGALRPSIVPNLNFSAYSMRMQG